MFDWNDPARDLVVVLAVESLLIGGALGFLISRRLNLQGAAATIAVVSLAVFAVGLCGALGWFGVVAMAGRSVVN